MIGLWHKAVPTGGNTLKKTCAVAFLAGVVFGPLTLDGETQQSAPDLANLSLDSLASIENYLGFEKSADPQ